LEKVVFCKS